MNQHHHQIKQNKTDKHTPKTILPKFARIFKHLRILRGAVPPPPSPASYTLCNNVFITICHSRILGVRGTYQRNVFYGNKDIYHILNSINFLSSFLIAISSHNTFILTFKKDIRKFNAHSMQVMPIITTTLN